MPWNIGSELDQRDVQPCHYRLHPDRRAHQPAMRPVPREQQLQPDQRGLLELPPDRLQRHHQPDPQSRQLPAGLLRLPHHHRLDRRHVQPCHHRLHAGGRARHPAVRRMPRQQQLQPDQRGLFQLPPDGLQRSHQPSAHSRRIPAGLHPVPWNIDSQLDERHVQPCHYRLHADRRPYQPAVRPVPREQQLQPDQRRPAGTATRPTTTAPPTRTTKPPTSRRTAPAATPPPIGQAPRSTMPPRASRWWACTPPSSARHATSTTTTA